MTKSGENQSTQNKRREKALQNKTTKLTERERQVPGLPGAPSPGNQPYDSIRLTNIRTVERTHQVPRSQRETWSKKKNGIKR